MPVTGKFFNEPEQFLKIIRYHICDFRAEVRAGEVEGGNRDMLDG